MCLKLNLTQLLLFLAFLESLAGFFQRTKFIKYTTKVFRKLSKLNDGRKIPPID